MSAEDAWKTVYSHLHEFKKVPYHQFKEKLHDHRNQGKKLRQRAHKEEIALTHDRRLYPQSSHNAKGEPKFYLSAAKGLLHEDVKNGLHETMTPSQLQQSRPEYTLFAKKKFKEQIYQTVHLQNVLFSLS